MKVTQATGSVGGVVTGRSAWQAPVAMAAAVALTGGVLGAAPVVAGVAGPVTADVSLAAFADPVGTLIGTVLAINNELFNGVDTYPSYPWEPYQGIVPEFIYTALPIISQLGFNGGNYIGGSVDALGTAAQLLTGAVWGLPFALVDAAGQAIGGDIPGALQTLLDATIVPIQTAGSIALSAGTAVLGGVAANLVNVVLSVPGIIGGLVASLQGGLLAIGGAAVNVVTQTIGALATFDIEGAWNVVINGLLGPVGADGLVTSSIPGSILAVTVGPGIGPLGPGNGYAVQSLRMWGEQSQLTIANAIGANYPASAAATPAPALAGRGAPAPAAAVEADDSAAPGVTADRSDDSAAAAPQTSAATERAGRGGGDDGGSGKQRASRSSGGRAGA